MRILIVGAGTIGVSLAGALVTEGLDIVVIDANEARLEQLRTSVDCQTWVGNALSPAVLEDLGIRRTDLLVAVTQDDAINMAVCRLADFYHVPRKLARLRNPEYTAPDCPVPSAHFGIDHVISPEGIAVNTIERLILTPGAREAIDFERGRIALRAMPVSEDSRVAGERVMDVRHFVEAEFLIAAIRRGSRVLIPNGQEQLRIGDTVYVICAPTTTSALVPIFNAEARAARRVIIAGAGITGTLLARRLSRHIDQVMLIENDATRAHQAAEALDELGVIVLHGSALDIDLLARCQAERSDHLVAVTEDDENNLMAALLYRKYGSGEPIVLTSQLHYIDILESVDIEVIVNPRVLAVSDMLRHIRGSSILSAAKLHSEEAEVVALRAEAGSPITRAPLAKLQLPRGLLVAAVLRDGVLRFPSGEVQIASGDRVLIFSEAKAVRLAMELCR